MNLEKIEKFIAQCRKDANLTQSQLAEKLYITDRAVSKWETGKSLPDASIMINLCNLLKINVNELLTGERIDSQNYQSVAEENIRKLSAHDQKTTRLLLESEIHLVVV